MAKVTPRKVGFGTQDLGEFAVEKFNMFEDDDLVRLAEFRNRANDRSRGIKIELMREYSRKTTTREGSGEDQVVTTTEEIILVVHYWQKPPKKEKGESNEKVSSKKEDWVGDSAAG
jgi:hypothetical protein